MVYFSGLRYPLIDLIAKLRQPKFMVLQYAILQVRSSQVLSYSLASFLAANYSLFTSITQQCHVRPISLVNNLPERMNKKLRF